MDPFDVEQWCARAATAVGVAAQATVARAHVGGHSVIVQEFVPGRPAAADDLGGVGGHRPGRRRAGWGRPHRRPGRSLLPVRPRPRRRLARPPRLQPGQSDGRRPAAGAGRLQPGAVGPSLRRLISGLRRHRLGHGFVHGDLSTRNLIADPVGSYVVLDWGSASAGPTPWTDLELIRRWHVTGGPGQRGVGRRVARGAERCRVDRGRLRGDDDRHRDGETARRAADPARARRHPLGDRQQAGADRGVRAAGTGARWAASSRPWTGTAEPQARRIFSMDFPLASSSTSLSR